MRIVIVGASVAGNYAALKLASRFEVEVFEEHASIGLPAHCTGIITKDLFEFLPKRKEWILNKFKACELIANKKKLEIPLNEYAIDRIKFDLWLGEKAQAKGAIFNLNHRFLAIKNDFAIFKTNSRIKKKKFDILIGADGANSSVAKSVGLWGDRKFYIGAQKLIKGFYDRKKYIINLCKPSDFFTWLAPINEHHAWYGSASKKEFLKFKDGKNVRAAPMPIYKKIPIQTNNIYLTGAAALLVKASTGGGIISSIKSSHALAKALSNGSPYEKEIKDLRRSLFFHYLIRKTLNKFTPNDYDRLLEILSNAEVKKIFLEQSREKLPDLFFKLFLAQPKLLRFLPKIII